MPKNPWHADLHPETKKSILAILSFIFAILFVLSYVGKGGSVGSMLYRAFYYLLGGGYFLAPVALLLMGFSFLFSEKRKLVGATVIGGGLFLFSCLSLLHIMVGNGTGGLFGKMIGAPLLSLFDFWAGLVINFGIFAVSLLLMLNIPLWRKKEESEGETPPTSDKKTILEKIKETVEGIFERKEVASPVAVVNGNTAVATADSPRPEPAAREESLIAIRKVTRRFDYRKPPLELLQGDRGTPSSGDIKANANIIKRTLENFGIPVEMAEISVGPTVTQYTLRPAEGVKLSKIVALNNDISLALAAHPIRIEAPIPGKSLVGIEVPNKSIALVGLRALLEHRAFQDATNPLLLALGRDVTGSPVYTELARMPHLLVSGATGSGKSVAMHAIITSLVYRNPPEMLRFIIVDPKRVELSMYNDIPHLLTPVITDSKKTVQALRWATKEMDRRYGLLSEMHARDITSYNAAMAKRKDDEQELLPYLVIIIDELADLMAVFPREVEAAIIRLAQMARAVGIHLIVATQRPSVEVITGLIKANITSRIAFQVASQVDSRTILDAAGAEKLLGNGDMLFISGDSGKPRRIQGGFVSEQEVKRVVDFLREEADAPVYEEGIFEARTERESDAGTEDDYGEDDPMYEDAKGVVLEAQKASASFLQRRLRVGYARAARLLDLMEARGVVGPGEGAKPREILMNPARAGTSQLPDEGMPPSTGVSDSYR